MRHATRRLINGAAVCFVLFAMLALVGGRALAQGGCDGLIAPNLSSGGAGQVTSPYGVSVKNIPATGTGGAAEVATLPQGAVFTVLDGPQCNQGYVWWQIRLTNGIVGWAAEGSATDRFMEPATVGLHTYRVSPDRGTITRFFVTPEGAARREAVFTVPPVEATPADAWQPVEQEALTQGLADVEQNCPERLIGTLWEDEASRAAPLETPLPADDYTFYPAPDGERLVLVRTLQLPLPRCDAALPDHAGMGRVTLLDVAGTETELFPFPQHGTVPPSQDRYALTVPNAPRVYLDEVRWSPDGAHIAFVAAYRDTCDDAACTRFHVYVWDVARGQLYVPGEGRHVAWTEGGAWLYVFRLLADDEGAPHANLARMRPDGTERVAVPLPGGTVALSTTQTGLGFPWNEAGTRVLLGSGGTDAVTIYTLADRSLTPARAVPELAPAPNRLAVDYVFGETALLWTTIRGEFLVQDLREDTVRLLESEVASTGVPLRAVRLFITGQHALLEMADGTAYVLDVAADRLRPVVFGG